MKISWNWLQEFVTPEVTPETVGEKLTLHTAELEEIINVEDHFARVYVGNLVDVKPHPDAEKLTIGTFDVGAQGMKQIIFGQVHPLGVGEIVPVALAGAQLASGISIENSEIRGQKSEGMVCDNQELGMKNEALLRFNNEKLIGRSVSGISVEFTDVLFDIDNKSLTHRPDLMGHRGFARELSAIFGVKLTLPEPLLSLPSSDPVAVAIKTKNCRRFCALKIENVCVEDSELSVQARLENLGTRAISNLVDITNWIMLEYGQPMHVFDADKVEGSLVIRQAREGEALTALDGNEYKLTADDMVIADEVKVLSIAGIMGGLDSSVTSETTNVVFEAANFDPVCIRKTSQRLGLRSESSMRFEKSLDPEKCRRAILAAVERTEVCCPQSQIASGLANEYPIRFDHITINLDPSVVRLRSGINFSDQDIVAKLESLGFGVKEAGSHLEVAVPSFRATKDVAIAEDLIEEVVRLHGFTNIVSELPTLPVVPVQPNKLRHLEWQIRDNLAANGFLEVYNNSFVNSADDQMVGGEYVKLENPLSEEYRFLRKTLASNALKDLETELRTYHNLSFFELGKAYLPGNEVLPTESQRCLLGMAEMNKSENELFFQLKLALTTLIDSLGNLELSFVPTQVSGLPKYLHPGKTANVLLNGESIGQIGVLHPSFIPAKGASMAIAEIELNPLLAQIETREKTYQKLSAFPSVHRDISLIVDQKVLVGDIEKCCIENSQLVQSIELFDEFIDEEKLGSGVKNLAFHLEFNAQTETLSEDVIESELGQVLNQLESKLGAILRAKFDKKMQNA